MKSDCELMAEVVAANPLDAGAVAAMADAYMEKGVHPDDAHRIAGRAALTARIDAFVKHCDEIMVKHWKDHGFTFAPPPTHRAEYKGKWCLIVRRDNTFVGAMSGGSATAFVALEDFSNKELGAVRTGEIYKPASYKKPAKHARGTVWREDFGNCVGPSGHVNYLR